MYRTESNNISSEDCKCSVGRDSVYYCTLLFKSLGLISSFFIIKKKRIMHIKAALDKKRLKKTHMIVKYYYSLK